MNRRESLNPYYSWMLNELRRRGWTVVVADPKNDIILGTKADLVILDEAMSREQQEVSK